MKEWYFDIIQESDEDKLFNLFEEAIMYYKDILEKSQNDCQLTDDTEYHAKSLPGFMNYYFSILQDIEAIVNFIDLKYKKVKGDRLRYYMEKYDRTLKSTDAEKYAETDEEVIRWLELKNLFLYYRNRYMGIIKALDVKNYQLSNIVKLKVAGFIGN